MEPVRIEQLPGETPAEYIKRCIELDDNNKRKKAYEKSKYLYGETKATHSASRWHTTKIARQVFPELGINRPR
jgi:hypothetical protein